MTKENALKLIELEILEEKICEDLAKQASRLVMGEGSLSPEVVFIGEAPGKKEDELGRPFVGASGKLLDELLKSIGIERANVYITNIVKYRPPENRDPTPEEKKAFRPYLDRQIAVLSPKVIATLGRHALNEFCPDLFIQKEHGKAIYQLGHPTIIPLYHPAAALYNGSLRDTLFADFERIKAELQNKPWFED